MKRIVVTGGCGFIGSHLIDLLLEDPEVEMIYNFDSRTYAGDNDNLDHLNYHDKFVNVREDIRDPVLLAAIVKDYDADVIFNLAACSHVDNSITGPEEFFSTNIIGTTKILEVIRKAWKDKPDKRAIFVSTDEVYGSLPLDNDDYFTEDSPLKPSSPYSASKTAADLLVLSYKHTYNLPCIVTRSSNNFGTRQHREKLIPNSVISMLSGNGIPLYGNGMNERDWLHVHDHCRGLILAAKLGTPGEVYNFGTGKSITNMAIVSKIERFCKAIDPELPGIKFVGDRPGHDLRYTVDYTKSYNELGWSPSLDITDDALFNNILSWYKKRMRR